MPDGSISEEFNKLIYRLAVAARSDLAFVVLADGNHQSRHKMVRDIEGGLDGFGIKADHRAGIPAFILGNQHELHGGQGGVANGFITLESIISFIGIVDGLDGVVIFLLL